MLSSSGRLCAAASCIPGTTTPCAVPVSLTVASPVCDGVHVYTCRLLLPMTSLLFLSLKIHLRHQLAHEAFASLCHCSSALRHPAYHADSLTSHEVQYVVLNEGSRYLFSKPLALPRRARATLVILRRCWRSHSKMLDRYVRRRSNPFRRTALVHRKSTRCRVSSVPREPSNVVQRAPFSCEYLLSVDENLRPPWRLRFCVRRSPLRRVRLFFHLRRVLFVDFLGASDICAVLIS